MDKLPQINQQIFGGTTSQRIVMLALDDVKNEIQQFDLIARKIVNNLLTNICTKFEEQLFHKVSEITSIRQTNSNIIDKNSKMEAELELLISQNCRLISQLQIASNSNKQLTKELNGLRDDALKQKKFIFELQSCKKELEYKQITFEEKLMDIEEQMNKLNLSFEKEKIKNFTLEEKLDEITSKLILELEKNEKLSESITFTNEKIKHLQNQILQSNQSKKLPSEQNRSFDVHNKNYKKQQSIVNRLSQSVIPMRKLQFDFHKSQKQGKGSIKIKNKLNKNEERISIKYGNQLIVNHQKRISNAQSVRDSERIKWSRLEEQNISKFQDVKSIFTDRVRYRIQAQKRYGEKYDKLRCRLRKAQQRCLRLQYLLNLLKKQYKKKGRLSCSLLYLGNDNSKYFAKNDENNSKQANEILSEGVQNLNNSFVLSEKPENDEQSPLRIGFDEDLGSLSHQMSQNRQDQFLNFSHLPTKMRHHYLNSKLQDEEDISFRNQDTIMNESHSLSRSKHLNTKQRHSYGQENEQINGYNILNDDSLGKNEQNIIRQCESIDLSPKQNNQLQDQVQQGYDMQMPCYILQNRLQNEKILNTSILQTQRVQKSHISTFQMFYSQTYSGQDIQNNLIKIDDKLQPKITNKGENFTYHQLISINVNLVNNNSKFAENIQRINRQFCEIGLNTDYFQEITQRNKQNFKENYSTNTDVTLHGEQLLKIIQNNYNQKGINTKRQQLQEEESQTLLIEQIQYGVSTNNIQMIYIDVPKISLSQQIGVNTTYAILKQQSTMTAPLLSQNVLVNIQNLLTVNVAIETTVQEFKQLKILKQIQMNTDQKIFKDFSMQTVSIKTQDKECCSERRKMAIANQITYKYCPFIQKSLKISQFNFISVVEIKQNFDCFTQTDSKLSLQSQILNINFVLTKGTVEQQQNDEDQFKSAEEWISQKDQSECQEDDTNNNQQIIKQEDNQISFGRRRSSSLQIKRQVACIPTISITQQKERKVLKISPQLFQDKQSQFLTSDGQMSTENKRQRNQLYKSEMFMTDRYNAPIFEKNSRITHTTGIQNINNSFLSSPAQEKNCYQVKSEFQQLTDHEISLIKEQFSQIKSLQLIQSVHLQNSQQGKQIFNKLDEFFIFNTEKNYQKSKFVYWKGKLLYLKQRKRSMYMTNIKQIKLKNRNDCLILGNSELAIIKNKLSINLGNKVRLFKGQMQEGEWKIANITVYKIQTLS